MQWDSLIISYLFNYLTIIYYFNTIWLLTKLILHCHYNFHMV